MSDADSPPPDDATGESDVEDADATPDADVRERPPVVIDEYTWADYMREHGYGDEVAAVYGAVDDQPDLVSRLFGSAPSEKPVGDDWDRTGFSPADALGFPPEELEARFGAGGAAADALFDLFAGEIEATPVVKDEYTWEHYKWEYLYDDGEVAGLSTFDPESLLGFDPDDTEDVLTEAATAAESLESLVDRRTVNVNPELDEDAFFSTAAGNTTFANRYDLEKAVRMDRKLHFVEVERYWVDKPYVFVVLFHSIRDKEKKYYLVSPHLTDIEEHLMEFLSGKLRTAIKYSDDDVVVRGGEADRKYVLERETRRLLARYDLYTRDESILERLQSGVDRIVQRFRRMREDDGDEQQVFAGIPRAERDRGSHARGSGGVDLSTEADDGQPTSESDRPLGPIDGIAARPEPALLEEDAGELTEYQVEKLIYYLKRDFVGYERIDGIKHDINVEDISCDGYDSPVFVYHTEYEQIITNVAHERDRLDDFVVKLAQRSGKGISQRRPQVDASLPDGSRAQLTLGHAVSDHGTNYTIRQFKDVPFTPVDLVNWHTFNLDQMAFLWLCIENERSLIFSGGTASGKTTSLNAVSLFIPNNTKIVSIEDTREVELPQRNWVASVTRPAFGTDDRGDIDEFDLLESALRQRPDYIVMGEVRGEEGRTLFQIMSTGHVTLTTFHADSVGEVLKRFTTDPINVSKSMFTSLDLVSVQTQTRVRGRKVRRNKVLTEVNHYDPENDEINVQDVHQWDPEADAYRTLGQSNTLEKIKFDRGWTHEQLEQKLFERRVVLAYLVANGLNDYAEVAATLQGFINDPETILTLVANGNLSAQLDDLRQMESVSIDVDPEKEALVPRPDPGPETLERAQEVLAKAEERLFPEYRGEGTVPLVDVLADIDPDQDVVARPDAGEKLRERVADAAAEFADEGASAKTDPATAGSEEAQPTASDGGRVTDEDGENGEGGAE